MTCQGSPYKYSCCYFWAGAIVASPRHNGKTDKILEYDFYWSCCTDAVFTGIHCLVVVHNNNKKNNFCV